MGSGISARLAAARAVYGPLPFRTARFYRRALRRAVRTEDDYALAAHARPDSLATILALAEGRRRVVEIGTALAWTAIALALTDRRRHVTTLDPFPAPTRDRYVELAPREAVRRIEFVQEFGEVESSLREIEFVFIDASHDRELTKRTVSAWLPALTDDALVAFHDYGNPAYPGVGQAIADLELEGDVHGDVFAWRPGPHRSSSSR